MNVRKLVTGLLVAVVAVAAYVLLNGGDDGYTIRAELPNAGGVRQNSSVKIGGVPGGDVKKVEVTGRDTAIVTMKLDEGATPIGKNASVEVRPTDLLGERYIALDAGNLDDPAPDDFLIAKSRAKLPVELDDVINTFDDDTRARIKILINEFGVALGSDGKDLAALLNEMPASLQDARRLVSEITRENGSLKSLLTRGDSLTASIEPRKDELASLVAQADTTLKALSDRREKLGRTLDAAPRGLSALNTTLNQLRTASTNLRPVSVDIENAAQPLEDTLDALPGFESAARDSLKAARSAAPSLTKLGKNATPPLQALTPTLANVRQFSSDLKPTLDQFDDRAFEDALWMVQNFALATRHRDGLGHQLGVALSVNPETLVSVLNYLNNPSENNNGNPDGAAPIPKSSGGSSVKKSTPSAEAPAAPAPATPSAGQAPTQSSPAPQPHDKGLLGDLADGVSGLLGGNAGQKDKPGATNGVSGLLDSLLRP